MSFPRGYPGPRQFLRATGQPDHVAAPLGGKNDTYDRGFEAGVQAERERVKARVEAVRADAPAWPDDDSYEAGLDAALAAIDKEGEGNE